jgi:hypothetical protein
MGLKIRRAQALVGSNPTPGTADRKLTDLARCNCSCTIRCCTASQVSIVVWIAGFSALPLSPFSGASSPLASRSSAFGASYGVPGAEPSFV